MEREEEIEKAQAGKHDWTGGLVTFEMGSKWVGRRRNANLDPIMEHDDMK